MKINNNFYILTGGPGSGKTTIINEFQQRGFKTVAESGRKIIKEQIRINGDALPWKNAKAYAELMLEYAINDYTQFSESDEICFFDRGIPDILGYERLMSFPINENLNHYAQTFRYNPTVFIFPPWESIYMNDNERKQDFQTAIDTYNVIYNTYRELDYYLIVVPKTSVINRIDFILNKIMQ